MCRQDSTVPAAGMGLSTCTCMCSWHTCTCAIHAHVHSLYSALRVSYLRQQAAGRCHYVNCLPLVLFPVDNIHTYMYVHVHVHVDL